MSPEAAARQKIDELLIAAGRFRTTRHSTRALGAASPCAKSRSTPAAAVNRFDRLDYCPMPFLAPNLRKNPENAVKQARRAAEISSEVDRTCSREHV
jgi:hypothetical protein